MRGAQREPASLLADAVPVETSVPSAVYTAAMAARCVIFCTWIHDHSSFSPSARSALLYPLGLGWAAGPVSLWDGGRRWR